MKNLLYNLDSVEESYRALLTSVIQIDERVSDMIRYGNEVHAGNEFERSSLVERLNKLAELNNNIQNELEKQSAKINAIQLKVDDIISIN